MNAELRADLERVLSTDEERSFFIEDKMPCCGSATYYKGPRGGACTNILCCGCGSKWNVGPLFIERLSEPDPDLGEGWVERITTDSANMLMLGFALILVQLRGHVFASTILNVFLLGTSIKAILASRKRMRTWKLFSYYGRTAISGLGHERYLDWAVEHLAKEHGWEPPTENPANEG